MKLKLNIIKRGSLDSRVMTGMYKYIRQYNFSVVFDTTSLSQNGVVWKSINIRYWSISVVND